MKRYIEKYFLFIFVFTISLVNISPLFAKKEADFSKEADKTAVDTDVCKRDTTKTGAEQYSAKCKEQCTSTDEKSAQFQKDKADICKLIAEAAKGSKAETDSGTADDANANSTIDSGTADANANSNSTTTTDSDIAEAESKKAETARNSAQRASTSTDALAFAKDADTAAKNAETAATAAETARDRIPSNDNNYAVAAQAAKAARGFANTARTSANEAAGHVINKARAEIIDENNNALNATTSTDALGFAKKADTSTKNAETALALIPDSAPNRFPAQGSATASRDEANNAALAVITKAQSEADDFARTAASEHTNVTNAGANRVAALAAAARARTAATNADTSAKTAATALALIPDGAPARAAAQTNAGAARTSANEAAASADAAEAAVPAP